MNNKYKIGQVLKAPYGTATIVSSSLSVIDPAQPKVKQVVYCIEVTSATLIESETHAFYRGQYLIRTETCLTKNYKSEL